MPSKSTPLLPVSSLDGVFDVKDPERGTGVLHPTGVPGILDMSLELDWSLKFSEFTYSIENEEFADS